MRSNSQRDSQRRRAGIAAFILTLLIGNSFYLLFCCSEVAPINDWLVNSIYKTLSTVGVHSAQASLAQRIGHGCFKTEPETIPHWALFLERTAIPIIESMATISISLIGYGVIRFQTGAGVIPRSEPVIRRLRLQFAHRQLLRSGVYGIAAGSLCFLILNSETVSLRLFVTYLNVLSAIGLPGASDAVSFYGQLISRGGPASTPPIWSVLFGAIIVPLMHLSMCILICITVFNAFYRLSMRGRFPPLCYCCGDSLRGGKHAKGPECGTAIPMEQLKLIQTHSKPANGESLSKNSIV